MSQRSVLKALLMPEVKNTYSLPVITGDNVLVISPHPDDETLGCGGAIIKLLSSLVSIRIVLLTDGNGGGRTKNIRQIRKDEFANAQSVFGYSTFYDFNYPDGKLALYQEELNERICKVLFDYTPKLILTPYLLDYSIDHQTANVALANALKKTTQGVTIVGMYEIWTPIANPNCYLNITDEYPQKRMIMKCYQSQEEYFGIIDKADALSTLRARLSMRRNVERMECFKLLQANDYIETVEAWKEIKD